MLTRLRPYDEYRTFGDDWVARIPAHWAVYKLKYVADVRPSSVDKKTEVGERQVRLCNYTDVYNNDTITDQIEFMLASATDEEVKRFKLQPDDVLVTKDSETWDDIAVPAHVTGDLGETLCGYHLALIRPMPHMVTGRFLFSTFKPSGLLQLLHVEALGVTRFALSQDALRSLMLP